MGLFILSETRYAPSPTRLCQEPHAHNARSAGYALFKAQNKKLLKDGDEDMNTVEGAVNALKLKKFTVQLLQVSPYIGHD